MAQFGEKCDYAEVDYASDLTDAESDEEYGTSPPRVLSERVGPRSFKRTYGVFVDNGVTVPERRLRSRIDEQLELLRAVVPNSNTVSVKSLFCLGDSEFVDHAIGLLCLHVVRRALTVEGLKPDDPCCSAG